MEETQEVASQVLDALGTAWTVHGLYPDPYSQPAFQRALENLEQAASSPLVLEVRPGGFAVGGEDLELTREGSERLSRRLFLHGVEALKLVGKPRPEEVIQLFEVLARDDDEVRTGGGVEAAMLRAGIESFAVTERPPLVDTPQEEVVERDEMVARALEEGADPEQFAKSLMVEAGEDPKALAGLFIERYDDVYGRVASDDVSGREEAVRVFVEAFFYLDDRYQVEVLEHFLGAKEQAPNQVFLDQFAGHELARLAPRLDPHGFSLLLDYARLSTDDADKRPDELLTLLESADDVKEARKVVAASVQRRIGEMDEVAAARGESFSNIRAQLPQPKNYFYDALVVLRGLFNVEERPQRFERLLRIWTGKIAASIRLAEYRRAELWLRAGTEKPTYSEDRSAEVETALAQLATPDILQMLIAEVEDEREAEAQINLLKGLGPRAVDSLIELLAEEKDASRRRVLMDVLVTTAADNPEPILRHLDDQRWYVVRNLAVVLGRIGSAQARGELGQLMRHDDHRVRIEALRTLAPLGAASFEYVQAALGDPHERVRQTAIGLLGAIGGDHGTQALIDALDRSNLDGAEKRRIVSLLAENESPKAKETLTRIADQRFVLSSGRRMIRDSAREALQERRR